MKAKTPRADVARKRMTALILEIPRDELALRIAIPCLGMAPKAGLTATEALDQLDAQGVSPGMEYGFGTSFRLAADAAVLYFRECVNQGKATQ